MWWLLLIPVGIIAACVAWPILIPILGTLAFLGLKKMYRSSAAKSNDSEEIAKLNKYIKQCNFYLAVMWIIIGVPIVGVILLSFAIYLS